MRQMRPSVTLVALLLLIAVCLPEARGAGGSKIEATAPAKTLAEEAVALYNRGVAARDEAVRLEGLAAVNSDPEERAQIERDAQGSLAAAAEALERAILQNPGMHQAYATLGYVKRRMGEYASALEAYDRAIALQPHYAEALEYRAEALLGLGRIDDAKAAHAILLGQDEARANELLHAMRSWIARQHAQPGATPPEVVSSLAAWVDERLSAQAPPKISPKARHW